MLLLGDRHWPDSLPGQDGEKGGSSNTEGLKKGTRSSGQLTGGRSATCLLRWRLVEDGVCSQVRLSSDVSLLRTMHIPSDRGTRQGPRGLDALTSLRPTGGGPWKSLKARLHILGARTIICSFILLLVDAKNNLAWPFVLNGTAHFSPDHHYLIFAYDPCDEHPPVDRN